MGKSRSNRQPAPVGSTATDPNSAIRQAHALIAAGHLDQAESLLTELCRRLPKSAPLRALLGSVQFQLGQLGPATQSLRKAVKLAPDRADYLFNLGEIQRLQEHYPQATETLLRAWKLDPTLPNLAFALGSALLQAGDPAAARRALEAAVRDNPRDAHACNNLGNACSALDDHPAAIDAYRAAVDAAPAEWTFRINLARALDAAGRGDEAIQCYWEGLSKQPDSPVLHFHLGQALQNRRHFDDAIACYGKATALDPEYADAFVALGDCLVERGRVDQAAQSFEQALAIEPQQHRAHLGLGLCRIRSGDFEAAIASHRRAIELRPDCGPAWYQMAMNRDWQPSESEWRQLQRQCRRVRPADPNYAPLHFACALCMDRRREYAQAFEHFEAANDERARQYVFDPVRHHDYVERLIAHPGARATAGAPPAGAVRPVFIVGMPRSGTTLVERILGRHPAVALGGEREDLPRLLRELADRTGQAYPECLEVLDQAGLDELAQQYLRAGPAPAAGITHATDKLPDNYLRLGLIDRLFPDALIVHVRRDPRAVCWSNYEQDFGRTLRFSYRLDHLVSVYRDYRRIMAHWRSCLNRPILDVDYERLVAEPEPQARLLLAFCGLNWHSDCVRPEDCEAPIHTASMWQARQPVYSGSVDRWRHYRPWLQVLEALAENPSSAA